MVLSAASIGHASTGGPPSGMSLGARASGFSPSIATRRSPSFGRSLAGSAKAGATAVARFHPSADRTARKPRRVELSMARQSHAQRLAGLVFSLIFLASFMMAPHQRNRTCGQMPTQRTCHRKRDLHPSTNNFGAAIVLRIAGMTGARVRHVRRPSGLNGSRLQHSRTKRSRPSMRDVDLVVVGAGVAGLTAAMFAGRYGLEVMVVDQIGVGGQISNAERIENFPGFPNPLGGHGSAPRRQDQPEPRAAIFTPARAKRREAGTRHIVRGAGESLRARAVIIAAGSALRSLGIAGEEKLIGRGVSHCAACDG